MPNAKGFISKTFTVRESCPYPVAELRVELKNFFTFLGQYKAKKTFQVKKGKQLILDAMLEYPNHEKVFDMLEYLLGEKQKEKEDE